MGTGLKLDKFATRTKIQNSNLLEFFFSICLRFETAPGSPISHYSKWLFDRGVTVFFLARLLLPPPSSCTFGLLLPLKFFFFRDSHVIITYWLKKGYKNLVFWRTHFFGDILLLSISKNLLQTPSSEDIFAKNFTWSNSFILAEDLIKWKRGFEIFLIDHNVIDIANKNIAGT